MKQRIVLTLDKETVVMIKRIANEKGISLSAFIESLLKKYLRPKQL